MEKLYNKRIDIVNDVLPELMKGEVKLQFVKATGELRDMRATRNVGLVTDPKHINNLATINTKVEIEQEVSKGTIRVYDLDKQAFRSFVVDRLQTFTDDQGNLVKIKRVEEDADVLAAEAEKHFDPSTLSTRQMIDILRKKVVRLVFRKSDGTSRVMVATRNNDLIELYGEVKEGVSVKPVKTKAETEEQIQRQIDRDYISVMDLVAGEFRTFKPSRLERFDKEENVASWIEFTIKNDAWYYIVRHGHGIKEYYEEGKRSAINIGSILKEREEYEERRREYLHDLKEHMEMFRKRQEFVERTRKEEELKRHRRQVLRDIVMEEARIYAKHDKTSQDKVIFRELRKVPNMLKTDKSFINMDNNIRQVKEDSNLFLIGMQIDKDVVYLHPRFIINIYSGRVYLDNTPNKRFSGVGTVYDSDVDWGSEEVLEKVVKKISKRSIAASGIGQIREDKDADVRLERLLMLAKVFEKDFNKNGIRFGKRRVKQLNTDMLDIRFGSNIFLMHPNILLQEKDRKVTVLYKVKRPTSRIVEYDAFFKEWEVKADTLEMKLFIRSLRELVLHAMDLRKRVASDTKNTDLQSALSNTTWVV